MCGICGFNWKDSTVLDGMLTKLSHRGPDDTGTFCKENVSLGHQRLSIIDLSERGHQPMSNEAQDICIVYNGEIYNYIELRQELEDIGHSFSSKTDTEVIIHAYEQWGFDCLEKFNGMWAFCIYDKRKNILFLARDRFGIKPLYYHLDAGSLIFASEIPAILSHKIKTSPNEKLISDFLLYNITDHTDETFFNSIKKIPKGHYGIFNLDEKKLSIKKWWSLPNIQDNNISYSDAVEKLQSLLADSINIRLRSDVPVGTCLSGGLDSSTIACLIDFSKKTSIKTFSAIFPNYKFDESKFIDLVSNENKIKNSKIEPTPSTLEKDLDDFIKIQAEPVPGPSPYSQYCVMKLAKENDYTVLLDGQGADEILAGYHYFYGFYLKGLLSRFSLKKFFIELINLHKNVEGKTGIYSLFFLFLPHFMMKRYFKNKSVISDNLSSKINTRFMQNYYSCKNLKDSLKFHVEYKLEHLLKWEDLNSMKYSLESRVPFLDYRVVEFLSSLPEDYILSEGFTKKILRDSMNDTIPEEILARRDKIGFATPEDEWLRSSQLKKIVEKNLIENDTPLCQDYIDMPKLRQIYEDHANRRTNNGRVIWKTLFLELWLNCFFNKNQ